VQIVQNVLTINDRVIIYSNDCLVFVDCRRRIIFGLTQVADFMCIAINIVMIVDVDINDDSRWH